MFSNPVGKFYKLGNGELFCSGGEERMLCATEVSKDRLKRVAQHFTALAERSLDNLHEQRLVAIQLGGVITAKANDSTLNLWRWVKDLLRYRKEILNIVPCL